MRYFVLSTVVLLCIIGVSAIICPKPFLDLVSSECAVTANRSASFYLNDDYDTVRKVFVRSNASTELVEITSGKVISQEMAKPNFELKKVRPLQWCVHTDVLMKIRPYDPELSKSVIALNNKIRIDQESMVIRTGLTKPVRMLKQYDTALIMVREGNRTRVDISVGICVMMRIPYKEKYQPMIQDHVDESCKIAILKLERGIRQVVNEHRGTIVSWQFRK